MYLNVKEHKNKIYISELTQDYKVNFKVEDKFQPELFVETPLESPYKSLINKANLQKITFNSIREFKDYKWQMKDLDNGGLYADTPVEYQYIRKYYKKSENYKTRFWYLDIETGVPPKGFPNAFSTPSPITLIQIAESDTNFKYIFGTQEFLPTTVMQKYSYYNKVKYIYCTDEQELIQKFCQLMLNRTPAITVAWNGDGFDFPYIIHRTRKIGLNPEMFSPFGILEEHKSIMFGKQTTIEKPLGLNWIDYIEAYKKGDASGKESWALEYMSKYILGEEEGGKLDYKKSGYINMRDFITNVYDPELDLEENSPRKRLYNMMVKSSDPKLETAFNKIWYKTFVDYGIEDAVVLKAMDDKKGNLNALIDLAQTMSVNVNDIFATVKPWQIHIWNELYDRNQFVPAKSPFETYKIPGGHVFAKPGLYNWVCSFDVRSLYPFCMISLNMSPETYIEPENIPEDLFELVKPFWRYRETKKDHEILSEDIFMQLLPDEKEKIIKLLVKYDLCMSPNGSFYKRGEQGIVAELVQGIYNSRNYYKKQKKKYELQLEEIKIELENRKLKVK
jgi:DNA polymerase elongation subunit (family B)